MDAGAYLRLTGGLRAREDVLTRDRTQAPVAWAPLSDQFGDGFYVGPGPTFAEGGAVGWVRTAESGFFVMAGTVTDSAG